MLLTTIFFIVVATLVSLIDIQKEMIYDAITIPAFFLLLGLKYWYNQLTLLDMFAVAFVILLFLIPILINMPFGGGDIRFGAFCALFVGVKGVGYFLLLSGALHLLFLLLLKRDSFAFAPAMSIAALSAYYLEDL